MPTTAELFQLAMQYHQSGSLPQAESLYQQILHDDPTLADVYHMLGVLAQQTNRQEAAVFLIRKAIGLKPSAPIYHFNLGNILKGQGNAEEAILCYHEAVRLDPQFVAALVNLAAELRSRGQFVEAAACYRRALLVQPGHAGLHNNLGLTLKDMGELAEAIACYRQALRIEAQYADALDNLGMALQEQGSLTEAAEHCRHALRINPAHPQAYNSLGVILQDLGKPIEAIECYRQALANNPHNASAHYNMGNALVNQGQLAEAIDSYRRALSLQPSYVMAHINLGNALMGHGMARINLAQLGHEELRLAIEAFREAARLAPDRAGALNNLGSAYFGQRRLQEAAECYRQALSMDPGNKMALLNQALVRLLEGDLEGGWPDYELRVEMPVAVPRVFEEPCWNGASLDGKTILVYAEGGFGDTIQFLRYLPLVQRRGGKILFECQPELVELLRGGNIGQGGREGAVQFIPAGAPLPHFDLQVSLMSLPWLFGTTLETIPAHHSYLAVDPKRIQYWQQEINRAARSEKFGEKRSFRIGIAWQANPQPREYLSKSCALKNFEPLTRLNGVELVSLQVGPGMGQLAGSLPILDMGSRFDPRSFEDLAATLMNMDLVVTVDTAVAHLAGALGKPVWVALSFAADWRWLLERSDSPWYPTMRLFRQTKMGEWSDVLNVIAAELRLLTLSGIKN